MYELAFTLYEKGEVEQAVETALKGSKYISDQLPRFYVLIANAFDDHGRPNEAINIYLEGIKFLSNAKEHADQRSSLYFNLAVTYLKLNRSTEARQALKEAVATDHGYASPHYMLSNVYHRTRYKIPAFLAASRFITLEPNTKLTAGAANIIVDVLKAAERDPVSGEINIVIDLKPPVDEGDFAGARDPAPDAYDGRR